ncbi:MAG: hypothetical protein DRI97_04890 [Bacteroidetes bacterium]|nr:MAG: hypothetical protein DRI97_04890 [Bacteroidota bacterium]
MKKTYYIPAILFFLICTTTLLFAQKSVYTFPFENSYRLSPMETFVNMNEISASYQTMGNLYTTEIMGLDDESVEQISSMYISDVKVTDAFRFLKFYMEEQLVAPGEDTQGSVEMSIIYYHEKNRANIGTALNILTLGIGTLLGIPFATSITDVEVEATFFNDANSVIVIHRGIGRGKKLIGLYSLSTRLPHQRAVKNALDDLNTKIMADPKLGREELKASL